MIFLNKNTLSSQEAMECGVSYSNKLSYRQSNLAIKSMAIGKPITEYLTIIRNSYARNFFIVVSA